MDAGRPLHDTAPGPAAQPPSGALATLTLTELVHAVRGGTLSPADLVTEALASLDRWQPVTTAASQVWPEEALAAARALRPGPHLALPGIPVLVKENMDVTGHPSTGCCEAFRDRRASVDAQMVTRLRAAGAVVVGKANMHELAASATGHISACGPMHNPWDPAAADRRIERRVSRGRGGPQRPTGARHRHSRRRSGFPPPSAASPGSSQPRDGCR